MDEPIVVVLLQYSIAVLLSELVAHNHMADHQITADRNCCLFTKLKIRRDDSEYIYIKLQVT
jgi:hypothetical protein